MMVDNDLYPLFISILNSLPLSEGYVDPFSIFGGIAECTEQDKFIPYLFTLVGGVGNQDMAEHIFITLPFLATICRLTTVATSCQ